MNVMNTSTPKARPERGSSARVAPPSNDAPRFRQGAWKSRLAARVLAPLSALWGPRGGNAVGILMYHRIVERPPSAAAPTWNVPPHRFRDQLAGLLARGFEPWPLARVLEAARTGRSVPPRAFVVTFDDGYENIFTRALPILRDLNVPATVFVATAFLDSPAPFPCDDWPAAGAKNAPAEAWRPLSTGQCRQMQAGGLIELAAHTHTHADFRGRPAALRDDLAECLLVLRERFGIERPPFAFPYGTTSLGFAGPELASAAREAGTACSLTSDSRRAQLDADPFAWGRFHVDEDDTADMIAAKLDGWYELASHAWQRLRGRRPAPRTHE
jgi:peptidoglycan/xylan/chitin deacetylase (PgdA/CDA1 family)